MVDRPDETDARILLAQINRYLTAMPDAGLTNDDPRLAWYVASKPLRDKILGFLSGHEVGCLRGQGNYLPYIGLDSCCRGYGYEHTTD